MRVPSIARDIATSALHRIDAWGVALIVCAVALVVHDAVTPANLLLVSAVTAAYGLGYVVNDYFDAPFDAQGATKAGRNFFVRHRLSPARAKALFAVAIAPPFAVFASFICLFLTGVEWLRLDAWLLGINFLASLSGQLAQQVRDFEVDSLTETNFATAVGLPPAAGCLRVATGALIVTVAAYVPTTVALAYTSVLMFARLA